MAPVVLALLSIALSINVQLATAQWWYLGIVGTQTNSIAPRRVQSTEVRCRQFNEVLSDKQRDLCRRKGANILDIVARGASLGIDECQHQFRSRRWNCTTYNNTSVFGKIAKIKSRETAYIYAISSAGVMYSVARSCAIGELPNCQCGERKRTKGGTQQQFEWAGCSHDTRYGESFSQEFLDSPESLGSDEESQLMNNWNNAAGRKAVKNSMVTICKCHGVSGSCTSRLCQREMGSFRRIGSRLTDLFEGAMKVRLSKKNLLRPAERDQKKPTKRDLVYISESPEFCVPNLQLGILGTRGRECNRTSLGPDSCAQMCCGRGYNQVMIDIEEECDRKFVWCCHVVTKTCRYRNEKYFCK